MPNKALTFEASMLDERAMRRAVLRGLTESAKRVDQEFRRTTQTWDHQPEFTTEETGALSREIGTDDQIYTYVDKGTRPHEIRPRRKKALAFKAGGIAKTRPGQLSSGQGHEGGTPVITRKPVHHPGTEPRDFEGLIARVAERVLDEEIQTAINQAVD